MKYLFFTPTILQVGGAQMYIRNKVLFLKERGYSVYVFSAAKGKDIIFPELKEFNRYFIPELRYNCSEYPKKKVERICKKIQLKCGLNGVEEIIVESTCLEESTWGELLSKKVGAKHIVYTLQETNDISNKGIADFFYFKYRRKELVGIQEKSLKQMFIPYYEIEDSYYLGAGAGSAEDDVDHPLIEKLKTRNYDIVIGSLGRLDKPFVYSGIEGVIRYSYLHIEKRICLLLLGGAEKEYLDKIEERVKGVKNIEVVISGYLYPVPTRLLMLCDAFFATAGSAQVCKRSGVPTVTFDCNDLRAIGVLGRTTNNNIYRGKNEPPQDFTSLLEDIIDKKIYTKEKSTFISRCRDYSTHIDFIINSEKAKEFFDVMSIKDNTIKWHFRSAILSIFGPRLYSWLGSIKMKRNEK